MKRGEEGKNLLPPNTTPRPRRKRLRGFLDIGRETGVAEPAFGDKGVGGGEIGGGAVGGVGAELDVGLENKRAFSRTLLV